MYVLASSAAITKYHRLGSLNNKNVFSRSSRGWKLEARSPAESVSGASSLSSWVVDCLPLAVERQRAASLKRPLILLHWGPTLVDCI